MQTNGFYGDGRSTQVAIYPPCCHSLDLPGNLAGGFLRNVVRVPSSPFNDFELARKFWDFDPEATHPCNNGPTPGAGATQPGVRHRDGWHWKYCYRDLYTLGTLELLSALQPLLEPATTEMFSEDFKLCGKVIEGGFVC